MADLFKLNSQQHYLVSLLEAEILTEEERKDLQLALDTVIAKKANALPELFDMIEYLTVQTNAGKEKIDEIQALINRNNNVINRLQEVAKGIFSSTAFSLFQIGAAVFKKRKLPARVEITDASIIPDDFKKVKLNLPLTIAKLVLLEHPELDIEINEEKADVSKSDLKNLWKDGVNVQGIEVIDDDFKVIVEGVLE